tara:strand:- start:59 stop:328 length:270 start_codon:yes stop_codon:yes gene_type:complete
MVIPRFIEQAKNGKNIVVYGNGKQTRDFTYIDDVVEATIKVSEKINKSEIINIAKGTETTMIDLAKIYIKIIYIINKYKAFKNINESNI